ncbi:MAG: hypothetical protein FWG96_05590 [Methanomassiliicoccaceae archaeon]|nr:hypothetical protein [Methanomassiliicoccaceae archaeon]
MNKEKKKNSKAFLALFVVAALAAVSFAGIALSDDSDAATILNPMGNGVNSTTIIEDGSDLNARFYLNLGSSQAWGVQYVTIKEGITVSGTIAIGTADDVYGNNFVEYASVKLEAVSDAVFTLIMAPEPVYGFNGVILVGDEAKVDSSAATPDEKITGYKPVKGSIEVTKGWLMGGAMRPGALTEAQWSGVLSTGLLNTGFFQNFDAMYAAALDGQVAPFTGTFKAGTAQVSTAYTIGLAVGYADGRATVFNQVVVDERHLPWIEDPNVPLSYICEIEASDRMVTFESGEFSVDFPENVSGQAGYTHANFGVVNVNMVVEEGATVLVGDNMPRLAEIVIEVPLTSGALTTDTLYLIPDKGEAIESDVPGVVNGTVMEYTFQGVLLNQQYKLAGILGGAAGDAFIATFSADGAGVNYAVAVGGNEVAGGADTVTAPLIYNGTEIEFDYSDYNNCIYAASTSSGELSIDMSGSAVGKIKVPEGEYVVLILVDSSYDYVLFIGSMPSGIYVTPFTLTNDAASAAASTGAFEETKITLENMNNTFYVATGYGETEDFTLTVYGDIICIYTNATVRGLFDNRTGTYGASTGVYTIDFEDAGMLTYGTTPAASPTLVNHPLRLVDGLNAAIYFENVGTKPDSTTFYYTSIQNALLNSNNIAIKGKVIIREDTTLVGPNPDANTNILILAPDGWLQIGEKVYDSGGKLIDEYSPKVSIPAKTIVQRQNATVKYLVESGQAIYDVKPTNVLQIPESDVLLEGDKFIYTDLWTALDISVSGQKIVLRKPAALDKDATLKQGVTMEDGDTAGLTVNVGITFTVNGTLTISKAPAVINGTLRIVGEAVFTNAAGTLIGPEGVIDVTTTGVLTIGESGKITSMADGLPPANTGVINVAGKLIVGSGSNASAGEVSVSGEVTLDGTLTATTKLVIGAVPTLSPMNADYTNTAVINDAITLGTSAYACVYGTYNITGKLSVTGTLVKTEYIVEDMLYATLYGHTASPANLVMIDDDLLDIIFLNWWENREFRAGDWNVLTGSATAIGGFAKVYAEYKWRTYEVTFSFQRGMEWVVNGVNIGSSGKDTYNYGTKLTVTADVVPGYEGTPVLRVDGASFTNPYTVTKNATFTAAGVAQEKSVVDNSLTLIEILLIIIVIIIAVIAIIVAVRLLRS